MKTLFYDLETTGVKPWKNSIHQIAAILVVDGEEVDRFNIKLQPNPIAEVDEKALEVGHVTKEILSTYQSFKMGYLDFCSRVTPRVDKFDKTDKIQLCGFNNRGFDDQFLRGLFEQNGDKYFDSIFWSDSSDVMVLASECLKSVRHKMENFQLKTVAKTLGIEVVESELHDALYDVELTIKIYQELRKTYFK
jgi:DNA polymerase-3 subunit epsilon